MRWACGKARTIEATWSQSGLFFSIGSSTSTESHSAASARSAGPASSPTLPSRPHFNTSRTGAALAKWYRAPATSTAHAACGAIGSIATPQRTRWWASVASARREATRGTPLTTSRSRCASSGAAEVSTALASPEKSGATVSRTTA